MLLKCLLKADKFHPCELLVKKHVQAFMNVPRNKIDNVCTSAPGTEFLHWISGCFTFPCNLCDCRVCASVWELEIRTAEENQTFEKPGSPSKWLNSEGSKTNGFQTLQVKKYSRESPNEEKKKESKKTKKYPHIFFFKKHIFLAFLALINLKKNP